MKVGETIVRAFFHCSSFSWVNPYSRGPTTPSTDWRIEDRQCQVSRVVTRRLRNIWASLIRTCRRSSGSDRRTVGQLPSYTLSRSLVALFSTRNGTYPMTFPYFRTRSVSFLYSPFRMILKNSPSTGIGTGPGIPMRRKTLLKSKSRHLAQWNSSFAWKLFQREFLHDIGKNADG